MEKLVIAIGGNAIAGQDYELQNVCRQISQLFEMKHKIIITHGNGPQIGELLMGLEKIEIRERLDVLVAMTQAQIGYKIQEYLQNYIPKTNINIVITRVLVDKKDPAFKNPTKPIGPLYDEKEAMQLAKEKGYIMKKVYMGTKIGYRRVVPSPEPIEILELETIRELSENGIVIACGGGGIPVIRDGNMIRGIEAVIDKDLASALLANSLNYDELIIATNIDKVKLNFMRKNEKDLDELTIDEAKKYLKEGHFEEGSMAPKIIACINFLEKGGKKAIITSTSKILEAIYGNAGTKIRK